MEDQIVKSVNKFSFFSLSFFFFFEHFPLVNYASVANGDNEVKQAFTKWHNLQWEYVGYEPNYTVVF